MNRVEGKKFRKLMPGFSLVEILLAVSISIMLISVAMTRFSQYNQRQRARAAIDRVRQLMREAKANAEAGKKDCSLCGGADGTCNGVNDLPLLEWRLRFNGALVSLYGTCDGSPDVDFMLKQETLPFDVTIVGGAAGPCNNSHFLPNGTVTIPGTCTVTATGGGGTFTVQLTTAGAVN